MLIPGLGSGQLPQSHVLLHHDNLMSIEPRSLHTEKSAAIINPNALRCSH